MRAQARQGRQILAHGDRETYGQESTERGHPPNQGEPTSRPDGISAVQRASGED
jgi:hypothetical protein